jgi:hypothetical protein
VLAAGVLGLARPAAAQRRASRLSAAVAFAADSPALEAFLAAPGIASIEAHLRFEADFPDDVIAFADIEWIEGMSAPRFIAGADWMALVGLQRGGALWVGAGTEAQRAGTPSRERAWRILPLGRRLEPATWYRLRVTADFNRRRFVGAELEGGGWRRDVDLRGIPLDYPNVMPFDRAAVVAIVGAMRGRDMMRRPGTPEVRFDEVTIGTAGPARPPALLFRDGFERQAVVLPQPPPAALIRLDAYERGRWYKEREEALFRTELVSFARSGTRVGMADARLD